MKNIINENIDLTKKTNLKSKSWEFLSKKDKAFLLSSNLKLNWEEYDFEIIRDENNDIDALISYYLEREEKLIEIDHFEVIYKNIMNGTRIINKCISEMEKIGVKIIRVNALNSIGFWKSLNFQLTSNSDNNEMIRYL
ncbi:hypothetical protein BK010_04860 [Tenericutes bacterium MO-XQ]|nr:hypothetical protein BK010_04860 [Tenericutes bacterium MO-XQ]